VENSWCNILFTEIDTLEYQQTEKIETEVKDVDRTRKRTGVRNIVQGVLLGHPKGVFLVKIQTEILSVFLLAIHRHLN
jgi:hypothetical protein